MTSLLTRLPLVLLLGLSLPLQAAAPKPHVLMIMADDLGFSDLGCYGSEIATPHLDSLAKSGLRFSQAYNTARCWPSRSALLSGYYAQQIHRDALPQLPGGGQGKRQAWAKLLPQYLKAAGYHSYHSGKWHIDGPVLEGGFERSLDMRNQGNYFSPRGNHLNDQPIAEGPDPEGYYATTATADHAIECLKAHQQQHAGEPFFQYVAFIAPHFPLHALPKDIAKYRDRYLSGWDALRRERAAKQQQLGLRAGELSPLEKEVGPPYHFPEALQKLGPDEVNRPLPWEELSPQQQRFQASKMAIHAAMIDRMDQEIGRIIAQLKAMGAFENTLICFASDNGASAEIMVRNGGHDPKAEPGSAASYLCLGPGFSSAANTPLRRHKTWVHEGGISTPLIAHWPAGIKDGGAWRHSPVHLIDFVPTVLELAGVEKPAMLDGKAIAQAPGKSLVKTLASDAPLERPSLWWLHEGNRAIRVGDYKLVAAADQAWELYDLSRDRSEMHNLAASQPDKVRELAARWQAMADEFTALAKQTLNEQPQGKPRKGKGKKAK
jgi:arylsulfatase A-like enzyme